MLMLINGHVYLAQPQTKTVQLRSILTIFKLSQNYLENRTKNYQNFLYAVFPIPKKPENHCTGTEIPQTLIRDEESKRLVLFKPVESSGLVLLITYGSAEILLSISSEN